MILATRSGHNVQVRSADFSGFGAIPAPGTHAAAADRGELRGIPAVNAAIRFAAEAVAELELGVWRDVDAVPQRVRSTWQARLLAGAPNPVQSRFTLIETIQESLDARGNAYIWREPDDRGVVRTWWALHPDQVRWVNFGGTVAWDVTVGGDWIDPTGTGRRRVLRVGQDSLLHIRGHGQGGRLQAPSPLELHRAVLQSTLDKQRQEQAMYRRGGVQGIAIIAPEKYNRDQAQQWRETWEATYSGPGNAGKVPLLGGGFQIQQIGLTMADAQYAEMMAFSVDEAGRIFKVQASLIGGGKTDKPLSPEHEHDRWWRFGLGPRTRRIVEALAADPVLFGSGRDRPGFMTDGLVHGDVRSQA